MLIGEPAKRKYGHIKPHYGVIPYLCADGPYAFVFGRHTGTDEWMATMDDFLKEMKKQKRTFVILGCYNCYFLSMAATVVIYETIAIEAASESIVNVLEEPLLRMVDEGRLSIR